MDSIPDLYIAAVKASLPCIRWRDDDIATDEFTPVHVIAKCCGKQANPVAALFENLVSPLENSRSEEHTSELQSQSNLVCRLLLEKKKNASVLHLIDTLNLYKHASP